MKIVGRTDKGYLAQISEAEIAIITGWGKYPEYGDKKTKYREAIGKDGNSNHITTDTEIQIIEGFDYIAKLKDKQKTAKSTANTLRELADMLENPIPISIAPSEEVQ